MSEYAPMLFRFVAIIGAVHERRAAVAFDGRRIELPAFPSAKLIRYNSCDRGIKHACQGWRETMVKTTPKTKSSAFMKPMQPSEDLAKIVGTEPLPRSEVTKKIWAHIKKHDLQNPKNKREILADDKLQPIFGTKKLDMFQMTKAVNKHLK
jgi:upstream activation factor subunit UAF30